jgi:hypothetical protein
MIRKSVGHRGRIDASTEMTMKGHKCVIGTTVGVIAWRRIGRRCSVAGADLTK